MRATPRPCRRTGGVRERGSAVVIVLVFLAVLLMLLTATAVRIDKLDARLQTIENTHNAAPFLTQWAAEPAARRAGRTLR